ncbi:MAG: DnaJ domain-containing protein [Fretibacterium sp.]|nr:DnaJ domain-containing protein [Fretibacterium sp.]
MRVAVKYKDYYEILGVSRSATQDEVRKAYRKLAKKHHPDVSKEKDAEARYKEINEAYEVLKDPDKRARYDALGANWEQGQDFTPPPNWQGGWQGGHVEFDMEGGFSDFFKTIFGGGFSDIFSGAGRGAGAHPMKRDAEVALELTLEEAAQGGVQTLLLRSGGEDRTLNVNLPRGIIEGSRIRLPGKAPGGGDVYVTLHLARHPVFECSGYDLTRTIKIAPWDAVLGGTVSVETLSGEVALKIPPGSQGGQRMRLRGKGLPKRAPNEAGDMYVRLEIALPRILTERQKELWEELAALG